MANIQNYRHFKFDHIACGEKFHISYRMSCIIEGDVHNYTVELTEITSPMANLLILNKDAVMNEITRAMKFRCTDDWFNQVQMEKLNLSVLLSKSFKQALPL